MENQNEYGQPLDSADTANRGQTPPPPTGAPQTGYAAPAGVPVATPVAAQTDAQQSYPYAAQGVPQQGYAQGNSQQGYAYDAQGAPQYQQPAYAYEPQKPKWSTGKKVALILGCIFGFLVLASIVGCVAFGALVSERVLEEITIEALAGDSSSDAIIAERDSSVSHTEWVVGTNWISNDDSYIMFNDDGTFEWYQNKDDLTNSYYAGTYEFYTGQEALNYITQDLEQYGITDDEMRDIFENSSSYSLDIFVCLVLNNEELIVDGQNTLEAPTVTPCYGFYFEDEEYLDIANMNTATYWGFTKTTD